MSDKTDTAPGSTAGDAALHCRADAVRAIERQGAFVERDAWTAQGWCRMERALDLIGTRSAMVLLREVFYGGTRFEDLVNRSGLSEAVVAGRLKELVSHGLLKRRPYREPGRRTRHEYVLTELGARLFPVIVAMMDWGELLAADHDTGVELIHKNCGSPLRVEIQCDQGHAVALADGAVRIKNEARAKRCGRP